MKTQKTSFERFEYKYWVSTQVAEQLLRFTAPYLHCDDWAPGGQRNTSLYLDSAELDFMRAHTESSPDRCKLRVRAYGNPPAGPAFFEIKRKVKAVTFKRRAVLPIEAVAPLLRGDVYPDLKLKSAEEEATLSEFLYLMLVNQATPKALLTCRREAYASIDKDEEVRLTLDRNIEYQVTHEYSLKAKTNAWIPLCGVGDYAASASVLVELKFRGSAPWWVEQVVQRLRLVPSAYSKYVAAMALEELGPEGQLDTDRVAPRFVYTERGL